MQHTPQQLKEKLLEGLDEENNVVDMPCVCEAISVLEKYPVTRDMLEETRIGRYVNELRRKTDNDQLAKRAKKLVRSWQKLVSGSDSSASLNGEGLTKAPAPGRAHGGGQNSGGPAGHKAGVVASKTASPAIVTKPANPNCVISSLSPRTPLGKPITPSLPPTGNVRNSSALQHCVKRSHSSPLLVPDNSKRPCVSPSISYLSPRLGSQVATSDRSGVGGKKSLGHKFNASVKPNTPSSSHSEGGDKVPVRVTSPGDSRSATTNNGHSDIDTEHPVKLKFDQNGVVNQSTPSPTAREARSFTHTIESVGLKTTIRCKPVPPNGVVSPPMETPKKRGRGRPRKIRPPDEEPKVGTTPTTTKPAPEKRSPSLSVKVDLDTPLREKFLSITPKVKRTAELIQDLQAKNTLSVGKDTVRKISEIQREVDDTSASIVPAGAKPRPRKKPGTRTELVPPSTPVSLKTKNEMVHKFLETSMSQSPPDDMCPMKYEMMRSESPGTASTSFDDGSDLHDQAFGMSTQNLNRDVTKCDQIYSQSVINDDQSEKTNATEAASSDIKQSETSEPQKEQRPLSLEEIYSKYTPLDVDNFQFDDGEYDMPAPVNVNDLTVDRLHDDHWSGVNGMQDFGGSWVDWTQTLSLESYNMDHLHVLPYVIVDD